MAADTNPVSSNRVVPKVSIGVPVYNGGRFIAETLNSLRAQTYTDFELIISDNGSNDDTEAICRIYAAKDPRIFYQRHEENRGLAWNYNHIVALAGGQYFKWATADDLCAPGYLASCVAVLDQHPEVVLAYPKTQFIDESGNPLERGDPGWDLRSDKPHERLRYVIQAGHWVNAILGLIRTSALRKTRLLPTYPGGDYPLLGELSLLGQFYEISESLFLRRLHPGASSQNSSNPQWLMDLWRGHGRICFPFWNRTVDHFHTIVRSDLSLGQKLSLLTTLARSMRWGQKRLLHELNFGVKAYFGWNSTRAMDGPGQKH